VNFCHSGCRSCARLISMRAHRRSCARIAKFR